ncbi:MAG: Gfo/Idh/MocA family oxidoreductase [Candidatus Omnitrophica bacterium]|nr:Gfo/Idh/MocA family oxidoreductase [Candidatus Omnitrophota bacterium]
MKKYKAAVIGCGRIGFRFDKDPRRKYIATHTGAYHSVKETDLVAVCDSNIQRLKECCAVFRDARPYRDINKMLQKENLDIVSICTPPQTHYTVFKRVLEFDLKAVFCEKPLAGNISEALKMFRLSRKKKVILQVDHQRRFDPLHARIRSFIKTRRLGGVQQVNAYYTAGIYNTGSHLFDLLRFLFGDVSWVEGFPSRNSSHKRKDPNIDGIIRFKNGIFATFQACDARRYLVFEVNCFLENGRVVLKNSGFELDTYIAGKSKYFSGYKELIKTKPFCRTDYRRAFMVGAVKHIVECLKKNKKSVSSGQDGYRALQIIEAAVYSARHNGRRIGL